MVLLWGVGECSQKYGLIFVWSCVKPGIGFNNSCGPLQLRMYDSLILQTADMNIVVYASLISYLATLRALEKVLLSQIKKFPWYIANSQEIRTS